MSKNKILVVEDEPSILKAMAEALRVDGFEVQTAVDAERAAGLIAEGQPDLILLDLILPGKNGFEFLRELKQSPATKKIPVVIMSNLGDEEEVDQGLRLGAADYLIKADYDLSEIIKIIKKNLR
jgi:two-component system phosphate regulon response regulator PhoB